MILERKGERMMTRQTQNQIQRVTAGILCVLFLSVMTLSIFYIVREADHDCTGEDCPVCAMIQTAEQTLQFLGTGMVPVVWLLVPVLFLFLKKRMEETGIVCRTLVQQKVRLNN
ncbi:MAG: hypothetical protein IJV50_08760 [Lachnospiraceae bacterium]|nr:hypothetical protein [Lachnospiraceae bacterium]